MFKRTRKPFKTIAAMALMSASLVAQPAAANPLTAAQGLNLADRFSNAIEAVQEGLDFIWPGDYRPEDVSARFGAGFGWMPDYVGSDNYRFRALPIIDIRYKQVWRLNGGKFTYSAMRRGNFEAGPLLNLHFGRRESSNRALIGLGDISTTMDVGAFARFRTEKWTIDTDFRKALGAGRGWQARLTAGHGIYKSGNFAAGAGLRAKFLSKKAMQTNFGITPAQAAMSNAGYAAFKTKGGLAEVSANVIGAYRFSDSTRIWGLVSLGRLFGSAAKSPIVDGKGSDFQAIAGTALTIQF